MNVFLILNFIIYLQLMQADANKWIVCEGKIKHGTGSNDVYRFDCSHLQLTWSVMEERLLQSKSATEINLSFNHFANESTIVRNYAFNKFENLMFKLDLSSNWLQSVEENAFAYENAAASAEIKTKYLRIETLDLSHNNFTRFPHEALVGLDSLRNLYFGYNHIEELEIGAGSDAISSTSVFKSLKNIHFNNCKLKHLTASLFRYLNLQNLEYLNLEGNYLKTVSSDFTQFAPPLIINLDKNSLECTCHTFWLKDYLLKSRNQRSVKEINFEEPDKKQSINDAFFNHIKCRLDYYEYRNNGSNVSTITPLDAASEKVLTYKEMNIVDVDDNQFMCLLSINNTQIEINRGELRLQCDIYAFPRPHIWWLFDQKTINRDNRGNSDYEIKNEHVSMQHYRSQLIIAYPNVYDIGSYKCAASYNKYASEATTSTTTTLNSVNQYSIYQQRLNQTVIKDIAINYDKYRGIFESNRYITKGHLLDGGGERIRESLSFYERNRELIHVIVIISVIIFFFILVSIIACLLIRRLNRRKGKRRGATDDNDRNASPDSKTAMIDDDAYAEIQRHKLRQHDGFEYDDVKYNSYKPLSKNRVAYNDEDEYDTVSRDEDAISSIHSLSSNPSRNKTNSNSNIDEDEENGDLHDYQDPDININLRKPGQIV